MRETDPSSPDVPYGADQTLFIVMDRISGAKEIRVERTELERTIDELFRGCFNDPVRVIAFNTLEHWVKDVSPEVAAELQSRCDIDGIDVPDHLQDFVETHMHLGGNASGGRARSHDLALVR
jgi:hypothetical protein